MSIASTISIETDERVSVTPHRAAVPTPQIISMIAIASVLMFCMSCFRHYVLRSGAFDLGFFDQAVWLISQGETPISSLREFHVLADHASLILYPLALLYKIWADPRMLLAAQSVILALGAYPIFRLSRGAGLSERQAIAVAAAYLMYPFVLTANLFDFHPETLAVPALLMAVLAARENKRVSFCAWIAVVLACKEILALTVAAMGLWLLIFERRRFFGMVAFFAGVTWFVIALRVIIPYFGEGRNPSGLNYYSYLGSSIGQIIWTMLARPDLVLQRVFSVDGMKYVVMLLLPAAWGLHRKTLAPLFVCIPTVVLNVLSEIPSQRSPFYQYSVPMVPFFFLSMIAAVGMKVAWVQRPRLIVSWAVALLVFGLVLRLARANSGQPLDLTVLEHAHAAIEKVPPQGPVLTTFEALPHLSQRPVIHYVGGHHIHEHLPLEEYESILLNIDHRSMTDYEKWVEHAIASLRNNPDFEIAYEQEDVILFVRANGTDADDVRSETDG